MADSSDNAKVKAKHGRHPNTIAALAKHKIKKGEVRNPLGGKTHNPIRRAMKYFMGNDLQEIVHVACTGTLEDLNKIANDVTATGIERGVAAILHDAIVNKDWPTIRIIISEIVGKVPEVINVQSASLNHIKVEYIDP